MCVCASVRARIRTCVRVCFVVVVAVLCVCMYVCVSACVCGHVCVQACVRVFSVSERERGRLREGREERERQTDRQMKDPRNIGGGCGVGVYMVEEDPAAQAPPMIQQQHPLFTFSSCFSDCTRLHGSLARVVFNEITVHTLALAFCLSFVIFLTKPGVSYSFSHQTGRVQLLSPNRAGCEECSRSPHNSQGSGDRCC